jgi:predicted anti-sigma-YlaC factor YlaD
MIEMKTCKDFCDHLSDYLEGDIGEKECELIKEHLDKCPPCELIFRSLRKTVDICGKGVSAGIPEEVRIRLKNFLREHCGKT